MKPDCLFSYNQDKRPCRLCLHDIYCSQEAISHQFLNMSAKIFRLLLSHAYSWTDLEKFVVANGFASRDAARMKVKRVIKNIELHFPVSRGSVLVAMAKSWQPARWAEGLIYVLTPARLRPKDMPIHIFDDMGPAWEGRICIAKNTVPVTVNGTSIKKSYIFVDNPDKAKWIFDRVKNKKTVGWQNPWSHVHLWEILNVK